MKKVFLVIGGNGTKIISENVLVKDLKQTIEAMSTEDVKVKQRDVESFANDVLAHLDGSSINESNYKSELSNYAQALIKYTVLTPYNFYNFINAENKCKCETCTCEK